MYRKSVVLLSLIGICLAAGAAGAAPFAVKVNFQLVSAQVPAGYVADSGLAFGDRGNGYTYGWSRDISADSRDRNNAHADQRYDTLIHFQKGAAAIWEIVVPNGEYNLYWVSGDPTATDQTNAFNVEGVAVPDPDGSGAGDNFDEFTVTVTVADGRLTIQPGTGASNSKICFIDIMQALPPNQAMEPKPADKATDIPRDTVLAWTAAPSAAKHNVYMGTVFADVNNATAANALSLDQAATTYEPANLLAYGQTYYWRIDEVNGVDSKVSKGETWSFTVEPYAYPIKNVTASASSAQAGMGPENTVNGSGLDAQDQHSVEAKQTWLSGGAQPNWIQFEFDQVHKLHEMWVWNSNQLIEAFIGFGARNVKVEYSLDAGTWAELAGVPEFAKATSAATYTHNTTVDFGGVTAKYVKLTINSNWGGLPTTGLSEVRFFSVPVQAREPVPAVAATGVELDAALNWRPGREAASHKVYFGKDMDAVTTGTAAAKTVTDHSFSPAAMDFGTTYYWRVDEVNEAKVPSVYEGSVWSFTAREYAVVDDFESYNDDDNRIYDAWVDGLTTGQSNSVVGYMEAPFAEQKIIHGGKQSMPVEYNNVKTPFFSEASREFSPVQNWTGSGADTLSLWVRGNPPAYVDNAGTITMSAAGTDIWGTADDFRFAYKSLSGDGSVIVKVESLGNTNAWAKAGVMIRQGLEDSSKFVYFIQSFSSGVSMGWRPTPAAACGSATQAAIVAPQWVKLTRKGDVFTAQYSADGKAWTDLKNADGTLATTTVAMTNPVYVGLCVTSHNVNAATTAVMSGVATTGTVSGSWQVLAIGNDPQPANAPGSLYMIVKDSAGKSKVVTNPDPMATASANWTEWRIPLSEFTAAGVKVNSIKSITVGVDSRNSPTKGGGMLYIDDVGFGRPAVK